MARDVLVRIAREDTNKFAGVAIFLAVVIFLCLPLIGMIGIEARWLIDDNKKILADIRREKKELTRLKQELSKLKDPADDAEKGSK